MCRLLRAFFPKVIVARYQFILMPIYREEELQLYMIMRNHDGILVTPHPMRDGFDLNSILQMAVFRPTNNIDEFRAKIRTIRGKLGPGEMNYRIYSNKRRGHKCGAYLRAALI